MSTIDEAARQAAAMLHFRRLRSEVLPIELFSEPAWDLLLELFLADAKGLRLTARDVCSRIGIAPSVMSRWLKHLSSVALVVGDGAGDLDDELTLSGVAFEMVEGLMTKATELRVAIN